jgi:ribosomal protein L40E
MRARSRILEAGHKENPMICTKCGAANRPGAKFCDECGQSLKPADAPALVPGPHPGMRYRRAATRELVSDEMSPAGSTPPKREPTPPPPRREPPPAAPKREARPSGEATAVAEAGVALRKQPAVAPKGEAVTPRRAPTPEVPAARAREAPSPVDEPLLNAEALHRRISHDPDVAITTPEPKRKRGNASGDHDNATIMIVLALVFFAILAVGASGVYFNLRESRPDLLREKAERAEAARNEYRPLPEAASFEMPPQSGFRTSGIAPDPPAVPPIPEDIVPQSNPAVPEPAAAASYEGANPLEQYPQPRPLASTQDESGASGYPVQSPLAFSDSEVDEMLKNPDTSAGKPESKAYKAQFRQLFGMVVIERTYPSMAMKQRALRLWTREQKILEPDGSINDKYAPQRKASPIPGH